MIKSNKEFEEWIKRWSGVWGSNPEKIKELMSRDYRIDLLNTTVPPTKSEVVDD